MLKTRSRSARQCQLSASHSLSHGAAFPGVSPHFWQKSGADRGGQSSRKLSNQRFRSYGTVKCSKGVSSCFPHMRSDGVFEVTVPRATCLSVIPAIGPLRQTPSLSFFSINFFKKSANLQVTHMRVVVKITCAVSKNGHKTQPFGCSLDPCIIK